MYIWLMKVSWLIDAHDKYSHGEKYSDPTGSLHDIIIHILEFVDDNNLSNSRGNMKLLEIL